MKTTILIVTLLLLATFENNNAQEIIKKDLTSITADFSVGYTKLNINKIESNGFSGSITLLDKDNLNNMYYGMDLSYLGFFKGQETYQNITSIGPTTGIKIELVPGYCFEIGVSSGISYFKINDLNNTISKDFCFNAKTKLGMGIKKYFLEFKGGYYISNERKFNTFEICLKYSLK